jgi:hypothetical protein
MTHRQRLGQPVMILIGGPGRIWASCGGALLGLARRVEYKKGPCPAARRAKCESDAWEETKPEWKQYSGQSWRLLRPDASERLGSWVRRPMSQEITVSRIGRTLHIRLDRALARSG